jgi:hypothetical protein
VTVLPDKKNVTFFIRISQYMWSTLFQTSFCQPKRISHATAYCSFKRYEPWTKKEYLLTTIVLEPEGSPQFSIAIISQTVQIWI